MIGRSAIASLWLLAAPALATAQAADGGRGAFRPYLHVLLAYGVVWVMILLWVWWIARKLSRLEKDSPRTQERGSPDGSGAL